MEFSNLTLMELNRLTLMELSFLTLMEHCGFTSAELTVLTSTGGKWLDLNGQIRFPIMGQRLPNLGK